MGGKKRVVNIVVCHRCGKEFPVGDRMCPWCHAENTGNDASRQEWGAKPKQKTTYAWERMKWVLIVLGLVLLGFVVAALTGSILVLVVWIIGMIVFFRKVVSKQPFMQRNREIEEEWRQERLTRKYAYPVRSMMVSSSRRTSVTRALGRGIVGGVLGGGVGALAGVMSCKKKETVTFRVWWSNGRQTTENTLVGSVDYLRFMEVLN